VSRTYTNLLTHVIFSTKDREPLITAALHDDLLAYMGGIVREIGGALRAANARPDHVHLLCSLPPTVAPSVTRYIGDQEKHHRRMTFQEELIAFLKKNGIPYDERYIWS
jgi:REP element-mobilizing transposase RayT